MNALTTDLPDGIVFVIAYLCILAAGSIFGGLTILTTVLPAAIEMRMGIGIMFVTGISPLILGMLLAWAAWYLWNLNSNGRIGAIILACLMALIGASGCVMFLLEREEDEFVLSPDYQHPLASEQRVSDPLSNAKLNQASLFCAKVRKYLDRILMKLQKPRNKRLPVMTVFFGCAEAIYLVNGNEICKLA